MLFVAAGDISITNPVSIMGERRSLAFEKFRDKWSIFLPVSSCELWKLCHRQLWALVLPIQYPAISQRVATYSSGIQGSRLYSLLWWLFWGSLTHLPATPVDKKFHNSACISAVCYRLLQTLRASWMKPHFENKIHVQWVVQAYTWAVVRGYNSKAPCSGTSASPCWSCWSCADLP